MSDQQQGLTAQLVQSKQGPFDLGRKRKFHEAAIQLSLFACGLLSIFTTIGIIFVLGNESIAFFTRDQWVNTNRAILTDMDEVTTAFTVEPGKALEAVEIGGIVRVGQEVMEVVDFQNNRVNIDVTGTGRGFDRFCATDAALEMEGEERPLIVNASRPVRQDELDACERAGMKPVGFRVGTDALAITVSSDNDFVSELTFEELRMIFGKAETWSQVRAGFPDEPIQLVIPGLDSGTFDFFVEAVFDNDPTALLARDPIMSENDNQLVGSIHRNAHAIGFFGYAYYLSNTDDLKIVALDGVAPSAATVADGSYAWARPLFVYSGPPASCASIGRQWISSATTSTMSMMSIVDVGYFQASTEELARARNEWLRAVGASEAPPVDPALVSGELNIAGSSTVFPLTERIAEIFVDEGYLPRLEARRGLRGENTIAPHSAGVALEYDDRPTVIEFFTNTSWIPAIGEFGVIPLINATLMTSAIAMLVALPLGIGAAIYLSEYATPQGAQHAEAGAGNLGGHPDCRLRLFRADLHDAPAARDLRRRDREYLQHRFRRHRGRHFDHPA